MSGEAEMVWTFSEQGYTVLGKIMEDYGGRKKKPTKSTVVVKDDVQRAR